MRGNICDDEEEIFERDENKTLDAHWKISIEKVKSERITEDDLVPQPNFSFSKERKVKSAMNVPPSLLSRMLFHCLSLRTTWRKLSQIKRYKILMQNQE